MLDLSSHFFTDSDVNTQQNIDMVVSQLDKVVLYTDLYEGFCPRTRWEIIDNRNFYPLAHAYESAGEYGVVLVWIYSVHELIVEKLTEEQFSSLESAKCIWIKGTSVNMQKQNSGLELLLNNFEINNLDIFNNDTTPQT